MFLGYAHIDVLCSGFAALGRGKSGGSRCSGSYGNEGFVPFHLAQHPVAEKSVVAFARGLIEQAAIGDVEGHRPVPGFLIFHSGRKSVTFFGMDMYHCGALCAFDFLEDLDETGDVVAFFEVVIFEAPGFEPVVFALSVALA